MRAEATDGLDEPPALRGRWTICAMLFVATTINYVDRQVLSILKPILHGQTIHLQPFFSGWPSVETTINVTDREYGYILGGIPGGVCARSRVRRATGGPARLPQGISARDRAVEPGGNGARAGALGDRALESRDSSWAWARAGIFRRQSKQRLSGFRPKSGRLPRVFSIRVRAWVPLSRPSSCHGWRFTLAGAPRFWSPEYFLSSGSCGGRFATANRRRRWTGRAARSWWPLRRTFYRGGDCFAIGRRGDS